MQNKGQSALQFVFLIALIVSGLIAMQLYIKRSIQGNLRNNAKQISPSPYIPGETSSSTIQTSTTSIEYSGIVPQASIKYPHNEISVENTYAVSQEEMQLGAIKKDIKNNTQTTREGSEITDSDYVK